MSQPHDPVDILGIHCDLSRLMHRSDAPAVFGWVDMKIWGSSMLWLISEQLLNVSSDWSKIDGQVMPILGRSPLAKTWPAGQGAPPIAHSIPNLMIGPPVPYIRPKRNGPTRDGDR
jgi:hypothetical protein